MLEIYVITDHTNGKQYVGQTIHTAQIRFGQHCKTSETSCRLLNRAINAHGRENFSVEVLEALDNETELDDREKYWIGKLNTLSPNGYNLTHGGNGKKIVSDETRARLSQAMLGKFVGETNPFYGKRHTEEARRKMSQNHTDISGSRNPNFGREFSEEHRRRLSESHSGERHPCYGKHLSEQTRAKISAANKGKRLSDEAVCRMATTKRGKKLSAEHVRRLSESHKGLLVGAKNPSAKAVVCIETGEVFPTIKAAAEKVGVAPENMSRHIAGKSSCCGKLHWKFYNGGD